MIVLAVEFYPLSALVENGSSRKSWENVQDTECAVNSFSEFLCYAATYFPETGVCIAEYTDMDNVPENVTLVNSSVNSTVLLRSYNRGTCIAIQNHCSTFKLYILNHQSFV